MSTRVLVVDDDRHVAMLVAASLRREGIEAQEAPNYDDALAALGTVDAVVSDLYLDDAHTGLELMKASARRVPFILMTGMADADTSAEAMRLGAAECLPKPFSPDEMVAAVRKVLEAPARKTRKAPRPRAVGEMYTLAGRAAVSGAPVLITGEEGAGKEHIAREIHRLGANAEKPFVVVWCRGLGTADLDAELQRAQGAGTILLKHVGELCPAAQAHLALRLAAGGPRVMATSRRDAGDLTPELRCALAVMRLQVPPVRERIAELAAIACAMAAPSRLTDAAVGFIEGFDWCGNMRQLKYAVASAAAKTAVVDVSDLRAVLSLDSGGPATFAIDGSIDSEPAPEGTPKFPKNRYILYKKLARTVMSEVWLGWQPSLWRKVVVKFCSGRREEDIRRFEREARILASQKHEGIPSVYEIGEEPGGRRYLVLEYIEGEPLSEYNRRLAGMDDEKGRVAAVVDVCTQVAGVLEHLHARGIVHRDLKPGNVLVTPSGRAFLIDYGMARVLSEPALTQAELVQGTVPFMSPEHTSGRGATPAADVWCLGATLYQLLTWAHPFGTGEFKEVALRIRHEEPVAPRILNAEIPEAVEQVVLKALSKNPRARYAGAGEMRRELEASAR